MNEQDSRIEILAIQLLCRVKFRLHYRKIHSLFIFSFVQGEQVAELILHHARANECQDVLKFKKEMGQLVDQALSNTLSLGKVPAQSCDFFFLMQC